MAPKPLKLSKKLIESLAQVGCTDEEISTHLRCSPDTLTRRYAEVLKSGRAFLKMSIRRAQVKAAMAGDRTMLVWLGKTLLGQKESREIDIGADSLKAMSKFVGNVLILPSNGRDPIDQKTEPQETVTKPSTAADPEPGE